jgi:hypothetical protein
MSPKLSAAQQRLLDEVAREGYAGPSTGRLATARALARLGLIHLRTTPVNWRPGQRSRTYYLTDWVAYPVDEQRRAGEVREPQVSRYGR